MSPGFLAPDVLYLATAPEDRAYSRELLGRLRPHYDRYHEPCVGAFGTTLDALEQGWPKITASDVGLYPSVIGTLATGGHPDELRVLVDGEKLELPPEHFAAGAEVMRTALVLRYEARPNADYWTGLIDDLNRRADRHRQVIEKGLRKLVARLKGIDYMPLDLWDHLASCLDDPKAVVFTDPPVYKAGYEKLWDTGGRLTWDEPPYELFDPETDFAKLRELVEDAAALVVVGEQVAPGKCAHEEPVYARHVLKGEYVYAWSNRPDEVMALMGGRRIRTRKNQDTLSVPLPLLEPGDVIDHDSELAVVAVAPAVARYYKDLWLHRLSGAETGFAFAVTVNEKLLGLVSVSTTPITRPYKNMPLEKRDGILMRWVVHPPHPQRLSRLLTLVAMQRPVLEELMPPRSQLYLGMSTRVVTIEYSKHPEVKGLRGLMTRTDKDDHPDGYKLTYEAPLGSMTLSACRDAWLAKEKAYARS